MCTPYLYFCVVTATLGGLLFGYHTAVISGALIYLIPAFQLSISEQAFAVSMILLGALAGSLVGGVLADRLGRKPAMLFTAVLFFLGSIVTALSSSYEMFLWGRFVSGVALGVITLVCPLYLAEISPSSCRGAFVSLYQLAITIGILGAFAVNFWFAEKGEWHWMFGCGALPAFIQVVFLFFVAETPPFLFRHHKSKEAQQVLTRLRRDRAWETQLDAMKSSAHQNQKGKWKVLFEPQWRRVVVIGILLSAFQQITGINALIYYAPKIFQTAGFPSADSAILATIGIGVVNVIATVFSVWLLDRAGRRFFLLLGATGMVVGLVSFVLSSLATSTLVDLIALISLMVYVAFFAIGLGPVTWVVIAEIFPLKIRAKAMTFTTFVNWFCNYLVSLTFLELVSLFGHRGTFLFYALICVGCIYFVYRCIPETKGRSLEEIEAELGRLR